jgi:glutamate/tyrosine decarboxylase-like PLP-dependent enzyme
MSQDALTKDGEDIGALLSITRDYAERFLCGVQDRPVGAVLDPDRCALGCPEDGIGAEQTLALFRQMFDDQLSASAGPRYLAFVTGGSTPAALMADWLVSTFDQNALRTGETIAPWLECEALSWLGEMIGLSPEQTGICVTGATMANFTGLATGRQWLGERRGVDVSRDGYQAMPPIRVLSGSPHSSIYKALSMLGIGADAVEMVTCLPGSEAVDVTALAERLARLEQAGVPVIVVGNAGVVNNGDFDDLAAIARLKSKHEFWLHVDGAFGLVAATSPRYRARVAGVELADSVTVDGHKWLNVPYDSGYAFIRHLGAQLQVFKSTAAYLAAPDADPRHYLHLGPESSRRWRALPLWFTLVAYGRQGLGRIVERCCDLASSLGELVGALPGFRLAAPVRLNITCITVGANPAPAELSRLHQQLLASGEAFLSPSIYLGTPILRAAFSNWRTGEEDVERVARALSRGR